MKAQVRRSPESVRHIERIKNIGQSKTCPLYEVKDRLSTKDKLADFITWLRFQSQKLDYRIIYYDLVISCAFIIFIFATIQFQALAFPNQWFFAFLVFLLICCCVLFIGIHMTQYRSKSLGQQRQQVVINWEQYNGQLNRWRVNFRMYIFATAISFGLSAYNQTVKDLFLSEVIWLFIACLFGYGLKLLFETIKTKSHTQLLLLQANHQK